MATLAAPDDDAGIPFRMDALGLALVEDCDMGDGKRRVVVAGREGGGRLLFARAAKDAQAAVIGNRAGGRVGSFVHADRFAATRTRLADAGVTFQEEPRHEAHGTVAVISDPFGNRRELIEPKV